MQELERKYYSTDAASGPGATQLQEKRDWAAVAEQLQGRCHISISEAAAEYEEQIDEVGTQGTAGMGLGTCQHVVLASPGVRGPTSRCCPSHGQATLQPFALP